MSETGLAVAAWLLTYALHSTVLLCAAALLTARWVRGEAWRETLWKAALLGGIVTASVQSAGWMAGGLGGRELFVLRSAPAPSLPSAAPSAPARSAETPPLASRSAAATADHARTPADEAPGEFRVAAPSVPQADATRADS
ncbi:MAG TPA: hypothetical protein VK358_01180, partial [Longimicrobium sp.]|nr:hypothetical protein [Longimicrobium sp.]